MRTAFLCLPALAGLLLHSPAESSLLPQIDQARQYAAQAGLGSLPISKHYVEMAPGVFQAVRGEKERRQVRFARWVDGLSGDRLAVYDAVGFPTNRHFENYGGDRTEHWLYADLGALYIFRDDVLIETRLFTPLLQNPY
ncbi:MAG TPA: hypothetical protein VE910_01530 [Dongiaceae bacterium]|nr:hypothetical protein [Dongiaceae bacterium]